MAANGAGRSDPPVAEADGGSLARTTQHHVSGLFGRDSLYMVLWAVQVLVAAVLTPVTTRILGPDQFGRVATATAVMQVVTVVAGLGLQTVIQREHASGDDPRASRRLLTLALVGALLVGGVLHLTGPAWSGLLGFASYSGALRLAVLWAALSAVTTSGLALLRSEDRLLGFACVALSQSVVAEGTAVALALLVRRTAANFVLGQLLAQLAAAALALALLRPAPVRARDRELVRSGLRYGLPLVPAMLSSFVLGAFDRLVIQHDLGSTAVAQYQVAYNIGSAPMLLLSVLDNVWMPRIFGLGDTRLRSAVLAASRDALYRLLVPVLLGLSLGTPLVLRVWAPAAFHPDRLLWLTGVVIVSAVPYAAGLAVTRAVLAQGNSTVIAAVSVTAAAVNGVLNVALVPSFGLLGAAVATFAAYGLLHVLLLLRTRRGGRVPRPSRRIAVALALGASLALAFAAVPTTPWWLGLRGAGAFGCVLWFLHVARVTARPHSADASL